MCGICFGVVKDAFSLWLNRTRCRQRNNWQRWRLPARSGRDTARRKSVTQKAHQRSALPGNWRTVPRRMLNRTKGCLFLVEERDSAGRFPPSRRAIANIRRSCHRSGKILNTRKSLPMKCLASQGCMCFRGDRYRSGQRRLESAAPAESVSRRMRTPMVYIATLLCALFVRHFRALVKRWSACLRRATAAVPYRFG